MAGPAARGDGHCGRPERPEGPLLSVFTPLIVDNAISYGAVGIVLIVESWLIGVGFVSFGGALFGRWLLDHHGHRFIADRSTPPRARPTDDDRP